jgi:hypothetical protein
MTYRCLIYDEEQQLDASLRLVLVELVRQISTLPGHVDEQSDQQPGCGTSRTHSRLC